MNRSFRLVACGAMLILAGFGARADVVLSAQSVIAAPPVVGGFSFDRTIDQSGLVTGYVSGVTDFATYVSTSPKHIRSNSPENYAASGTTPPQNVDFDLGAEYSINSLAFWNYPFMDPGGVTAFQILTSDQSSFSTSFLAGAFTPINDGDNNINTVQAFDLIDSSARYVRFRMTGEQGGSGFGFSEIAFGVSQVAVVPEPGSAAILTGFGVIGLLALRRRRRLGLSRRG